MGGQDICILPAPFQRSSVAVTHLFESLPHSASLSRHHGGRLGKRRAMQGISWKWPGVTRLQKLSGAPSLVIKSISLLWAAPEMQRLHTWEFLWEPEFIQSSRPLAFLTDAPAWHRLHGIFTWKMWYSFFTEFCKKHRRRHDGFRCKSKSIPPKKKREPI